MTFRLQLLGLPKLVDQHMGLEAYLSTNKPTRLLAYMVARVDWEAFSTLEFLADLVGQTEKTSVVRTIFHRASKDLSELTSEQRSLVAGLFYKNFAGKYRSIIQNDVQEFRQAIQQSNWQKAVRLYHGEFLQGMKLEVSNTNEAESGLLNALASIRQELFESWLIARIKLVERYRKDPLVPGSVKDAIQDLTQLLAVSSRVENPELGKKLVGFAIDFALFAGEPHLARKWYDAYVESLPEGLEPDLEVTKLLESISSLGDVNHGEKINTLGFKGRGNEYEHLCELFANPNCRLLSILGPGGIGKSLLAAKLYNHEVFKQKQVLTSALGRFRDGLNHVSMRGVRSAQDAFRAIAAATKITFCQPSLPPQTELLHAFKGQERLIFLDNFEDALPFPEVRAFLNDVLFESPKIKFLVTSRERLEQLHPPLLIGLEERYELAGMNPQDAEILLVSLAEQEKPGSSKNLDEHVLQAFYNMVRGYPLLMELAAKNFGDQALNEHLSALLGHLDHKVFTQAQQVILEQSVARLPTKTQQAFYQLSVFPYRFTQDAAQNVSDCTLEHLNLLIRHSLVQRLEQGGMLHPVLRELAFATLEPTQQTALQEKHLEYHLKAVASNQEQIRWMHDLANLRLAWETLFRAANPNPDQIAEQAKLAQNLGLLVETRDLAGFTLKHALTPSHAQATAHLILAQLERRQNIGAAQLHLEQVAVSCKALNLIDLEPTLALEQGLNFLNHDLEAAKNAFETALHGFEKQQQPLGAAKSHRQLARVANEARQFEVAQQHLTAALTNLQHLNEPLEQANVLTVLGIVSIEQKDYLKARQFIHASTDLYTRIGVQSTQHFIALNNGTLGHIERDLGNFEASLDHYFAAREVFSGTNDQKNLGNVYAGIGAVQTQQRHIQESLESLDTALTLSSELGAPARQLENLYLIADALRFIGSQDGFRRSKGLVDWLIQSQHPALEQPVFENAQNLLLKLEINEVFSWGKELNEIVQAVLEYLKAILRQP